jgi:prophage regulatory protein
MSITNITKKTEQQIEVNALPQYGLLRLWQILGIRRKGIPPIIPVSKSTWWAGVKSGKYPKPVKLSARCTCWYVEDIRKLMEQIKQP